MSDLSEWLRGNAESAESDGWPYTAAKFQEAAEEIEALQATVAELQEKRLQAAVEGSDWKARALRAEAIVDSLPKDSDGKPIPVNAHLCYDFEGTMWRAKTVMALEFIDGVTMPRHHMVFEMWRQSAETAKEQPCPTTPND